MPRIQRLDTRTANQIAAGEVVERPASVVKELVENSLDAGAGAIRVELRGGGIEEIRVLDDGSGMDRQDLSLALERHATSKIRTLEELAGLQTLGFRGEALPSIASVSEMTLESSCDPGSGGHRVEVKAGQAQEPRAVGHPRGTTVTVRNLFFNTPARRKFLRSESSELERILDIMSRCALAHFDRRFSLTADGRSLLDLPPASSRADRVRQVFGDDVARRLVPFDRKAGSYRAWGFASEPEFTRATARDLRLFLNGRPVGDRGLHAAILQAYATFLPRGRYPFVLLLVEAPPDRVDFNVHPTKWEVRFTEPRVLFDLVRGSIRSALQEERPVAAWRALREDGASAVAGGGSGLPPAGPALHADRTTEASAIWEFSAVCEAQEAPERRLPGAPTGPGIPLGQYRESYILASDEQGLMIVDQHAAHERILYERLLRQSRERRVERQALLFPVSLGLDPERSLRLERGRARLEQLGFGLEVFGENTWLVREIPALLGEIDVLALVRDLTDDLTDTPTPGELDRILDRLAATTACHAAVKVNFPLTSEKMSFLLEELARADAPMTCPHGRPVVLRISHRDLEKNFRRR